MNKAEVAAISQEIREVQAQRRQLQPERAPDASRAHYLDGLVDGLKRALNVTRRAKASAGR